MIKKNSKSIFFIITLLAYIALFYGACSNTETTGTISETEHGVLGEIVFNDGSKEAGIPVIAYASEADSARPVDTVFTNTEGKYLFNNLKTGFYNFEAKVTKNSDLLIAFGKKRYVDSVVLSSSDITFETDTLKIPATLKGLVTFADTATGPVEIYLYGTHYRTYSNSDSTYELYPIPSDIYFDVVYSITGYGDTVYYDEVFDPGEVDVYDQHLEADIVPPEGMVIVNTKRGGPVNLGMDTANSDYYDVPMMLITMNYNILMDQTEVIQKEFSDLMGSNYSSIYNEPNWSVAKGDSLPVYNINWYEALLFCNARSKQEGLDSVYAYDQITGTIGYGTDSINSVKLENLFYDSLKNGYRLPIEAEWHFSSITEEDMGQFSWYWGNSTNPSVAGQYAWYSENSLAVQKVGRLKPNDFNLFDMLGNVNEWCYDWYDTSIVGDFSIMSDYEGPESGTLKVIRGGSFQDGIYNFEINRRRDCHPAQAIEGIIGFRCVRRLY